MRKSGILLHIASLPNDYGIGSMGREAYDFVDYLKKSGQSIWQILPLSQTSYGDSPYQSFSIYAGNPYFISLDVLAEEGLLKKSEYENIKWCEDPRYIDYATMYEQFYKVMKHAYRRFSLQRNGNVSGEYRAFLDDNKWLHDYALFMALKDAHGGKAWSEWKKPLRLREPSAVKSAEKKYEAEMDFYIFLQFKFFQQWHKLKKYANDNGIEIIGDIPIYVSPDCADVWAQPELFELDEKRVPKRVAGVPPDYFSATGQLWGNPLYNWEEMHKTGYKWWLKRIGKSKESFDMLRIDHFRAFDTYYAIPYGHKTAENGTWEKGPGIELFNAIKNDLGDVNIIAEDLGDIFDSVKELLRDTGFPGMRVLQFGFNPDNTDNDHLPHNYPKNCCAYTGTHDNSTIMQWYREADPKSRAMARRYVKPRLFERFSAACVRVVYASPANLAIIPMQDILGLGADARMNVPSTVGGNWKWRMLPGRLTASRAEKLRSLADTYFR